MIFINDPCENLSNFEKNNDVVRELEYELFKKIEYSHGHGILLRIQGIKCELFARVYKHSGNRSEECPGKDIQRNNRIYELKDNIYSIKDYSLVSRMKGAIIIRTTAVGISGNHLVNNKECAFDDGLNFFLTVVAFNLYKQVMCTNHCNGYHNDSNNIKIRSNPEEILRKSSTLSDLQREYIIVNVSTVKETLLMNTYLVIFKVKRPPTLNHRYAKFEAKYPVEELLKVLNKSHDVCEKHIPNIFKRRRSGRNCSMLYFHRITHLKITLVFSSFLSPSQCSFNLFKNGCTALQNYRSITISRGSYGSTIGYLYQQFCHGCDYHDSQQQFENSNNNNSRFKQKTSRKSRNHKTSESDDIPDKLNVANKHTTMYGPDTSSQLIASDMSKYPLKSYRTSNEDCDFVLSCSKECFQSSESNAASCTPRTHDGDDCGGCALVNIMHTVDQTRRTQPSSYRPLNTFDCACNQQLQAHLSNELRKNHNDKLQHSDNHSPAITYVVVAIDTRACPKFNAIEKGNGGKHQNAIDSGMYIREKKKRKIASSCPTIRPTDCKNAGEWEASSLPNNEHSISSEGSRLSVEKKDGHTHRENTIGDLQSSPKPRKLPMIGLHRRNSSRKRLSAKHDQITPSSQSADSPQDDSIKMKTKDKKSRKLKSSSGSTLQRVPSKINKDSKLSAEQEQLSMPADDEVKTPKKSPVIQKLKKAFSCRRSSSKTKDKKDDTLKSSTSKESTHKTPYVEVSDSKPSQSSQRPSVDKIHFHLKRKEISHDVVSEESNVEKASNRSSLGSHSSGISGTEESDKHKRFGHLVTGKKSSLGKDNQKEPSEKSARNSDSSSPSQEPKRRTRKKSNRFFSHYTTSQEDLKKKAVDKDSGVTFITSQNSQQSPSQEHEHIKDKKRRKKDLSPKSNTSSGSEKSTRKCRML
ncbi:unnamed protein product, partial [Trichobilharzia regenti]